MLKRTTHAIYRIGFSGLLWRSGLILILALTFFPLIFMLVTSFKTTHQFYHSFWLPQWPLQISNYGFALNDMKFYILNSLIVTVLSVGGTIACSTLTGFLFARYVFPGREILYYGIIAMMMIPATLTLIPAFMWVQQLGLIDTLWVMILPYIAGSQVLGLYLLRSFFGQIDKGLFEAAQVDGAGLFRQFFHLALPLSKPIIGVVVIVTALGVWNNFLWPLVTTSSDEVMVLTVGLFRYTGRAGADYGKMFSGYAVSAIPLGVLFMFCARLFMKGITAGAIKG